VFFGCRASSALCRFPDPFHLRLRYAGGKTMKTINLTCNHCGAPLEAAEDTKFVTCRFCSSRLAVEHSASAFYTRVVEAIEQQTNALSQDLETIKIQNEIERLDREWQMQREQLCRRGKDGQLREPTVTGNIIGSILFALFGVFWLVMASSVPSFPGIPIFAIVPLVGFGVIVFSIVGLIRGIAKAREYEDNKASYESRRRRLVADLGRRDGND
jgi:DNA-directed RNA polymerase subunit RPC12/RpoP